MKKAMPYILLFFVLTSTSLALGEQSLTTWEKVKKFFFDIIEDTKAVVSKVVNAGQSASNTVLGTKFDTNTYQPQQYVPGRLLPATNVPSSTPQTVGRNDLTQTNPDKPIQLTTDTGSQIVVARTTKTYKNVIDTYEAIWYDVDIAGVRINCPDCQVINGVKQYTAGFQFEMFIDLINHGNTAASGVELIVDIEDDYGYKYHVSLTGSNALILPSGEQEVKIILPKIGVEDDGRTIKPVYVYSATKANDDYISNLEMRQQVKNSAKIVEPELRIVQKVKRVCVTKKVPCGETTCNRQECENKITYEEEKYYPDIPEKTAENDYTTFFPVEKLTPLITNSGTKLCTGNTAIEVRIC